MTSEGYMKPGLYRLSRDVENPSVDRRKRDRGWDSPIMRKGTLFVVRSATERSDQATEIRMEGSGYDWRPARVPTARPGVHAARMQALIPNLTPVTPSTVHEVMISTGTTVDQGDAVLQYLVNSGAVTLDAVAHAYHIAENDMDAFDAVVPGFWSR